MASISSLRTRSITLVLYCGAASVEAHQVWVNHSSTFGSITDELRATDPSRHFILLQPHWGPNPYWTPANLDQLAGETCQTIYGVIQDQSLPYILGVLRTSHSDYPLSIFESGQSPSLTILEATTVSYPELAEQIGSITQLSQNLGTNEDDCGHSLLSEHMGSSSTIFITTKDKPPSDFLVGSIYSSFDPSSPTSMPDPSDAPIPPFLLVLFAKSKLLVQRTYRLPYFALQMIHLASAVSHLILSLSNEINGTSKEPSSNNDSTNGEESMSDLVRVSPVLAQKFEGFLNIMDGIIRVLDSSNFNFDRVQLQLDQLYYAMCGEYPGAIIVRHSWSRFKTLAAIDREEAVVPYETDNTSPSSVHHRPMRPGGPLAPTASSFVDTPGVFFKSPTEPRFPYWPVIDLEPSAGSSADMNYTRIIPLYEDFAASYYAATHSADSPTPVSDHSDENQRPSPALSLYSYSSTHEKNHDLHVVSVADIKPPQKWDPYQPSSSHYSTSSTQGLHTEAQDPDSLHSMSNPINAPSTTPPILGTRPWLQSRLTNLSPYQRSEVESRFEAWLHDPDRQILVVNILCDWFEQERQPQKEDLLKFYQAKLGVAEDGGKGAQGARGGVIGYTCEWPGCGKKLSGRTDRVEEDALNHLNIKIFACNAKYCNASFLRQNELNRHIKSCRFQHPDTNAFVLTMPSTPMVASTSRQTTGRSASNRPLRRNTRSVRGVSDDIYPSTSDRENTSMPPMTDSSFQSFPPQALPQDHFQPMNQHTPQMSLFGNMADVQMRSHEHSTQQQQSPPSAPPTLLQGQAQAEAHASSILILPPGPSSRLSSTSDTGFHTDNSMPLAGSLPVPPMSGLTHHAGQSPPPSTGSPAGLRQSASPTPGVSGENFGDIEHSPSLPPKANTVAASLYGRRLLVGPSRNSAKPEDIPFLAEPYLDPQILEEEERKNVEIRGEIKLVHLQFGWPCHDGGVSIEWESPADLSWTLEFDPEARRLTIKSKSGLRVVVMLSNVTYVALDTQTSIFWLERSPILEQEKQVTVDRLATTLSLLTMMYMPAGLGPTRDRLTTLDPERGDIFAFLRAIRVTFDTYISMKEFQFKAKKAQLTTHMEVHRISMQGLFHPLVVRDFREWLREVPFDVAFQIDGLVSRCWYSPKELWEMKPTIEAAIEEYGSTTISECIRLLEQRREEDEEHQSGMDLFQSILRNLRRDRRKKPLRQSNESGEIFHCHRVTVTPTSLILTGPLPDVTNRVLRKYMKHQSNFMRVEFRDENRLQIRLDREVDSSKFMNDRVGTILQHGLTIAGREFEFLAYSFSALKEHAVWFINPFDGEEGRVDAEFIRSELGDFSRVIRCPARYGARIAQAFSTTEPSITVVAEELIPIPDKKSNSDPPYLFTDGVGTISQEIAEEIWEGFTETRSNRSRRRVQTPSAYQIRLGGLKGMLCVDERLSGRIVCTRPSMDKFTAPDLTVEIARAFDRPMYMYLNRPLIMLLETLGLSKEPFMELQMDAVKQTVAASKSMDSASRLLEQHGLGTAFHMTSVLLNLHKINVDPESTQHDGQLISFIRRSLKFAVNHVLRDLKYKARIPVPDAWTLVGVADEYGYLKEGEIYAYVCTIDGKKQYIEGPVMISRSPTVHPGDARMVRAIGKPPENAPAGLARLTNCVVFSCKGERSLPSMLGGGDLDGDMYCLVMDKRLHPPKAHVPASYTQAKLQLLDRDATASDIAQFVVDYIKNDLLGVIANQILLTADLSPAVMADPDCLILAAKHSDAVDYPKTGQPVNFSDLPKPKSKRKPDWYANETNERKTGFYQSSRIIGHLFRAIHLPAIPEAQRVARRRNRQLEDNYENSELRAVTSIYLRSDSLIGQLLKRKLDEYVDLEYHACGDIKGEIEEMLDIFEGYGDQLAYTCRNHSLAKWTPLTEEEVVAGTIVAKCSQPRMRADMITAMRRDSTSLVTATREAIEGDENNSLEDIILRGWTAWKVSVASGETFGARSFGLLALDIIFSSIRRIDTDALY